MAKNVSVFVSASGLIAGFWTEFMQAVKECGGSDEDIHKLGKPEGRPLIRQFAELTVSAARRIWPFKDRRPMECGWKGVEREGAPCDGPIDISRLEAVPFHKDGERFVSGEEMMRRARDAKDFPGCSEWSQHHAEQLLEQAAELPKEWARDDGPALLFPDTVLLGEDGDRSVPCLFWGVGEWQLGWGWLGSGFDRGCRLLRLRK